MFSVKSTFLSAALGCAAIFMAAPTAAQAGVVIKSSGPSASKYPVGTKLSNSARITLKAGDSVTILADRGTRVIRGAGTHRVSKRGVSKRNTFSSLTRQRSARAVRTGATRTGRAAPSPINPNLWWVDVSKSGTMCVSDLDAVQMWRPGFAEASTYVIASGKSAEHVHATFAKEEMVALWDGDRLPLTEGASYTITAPDGSTSSTVTIAQLDSPPDEIEALTLALLEKGCMAQVDLLAASLK